MKILRIVLINIVFILCLFSFSELKGQRLINRSNGIELSYGTVLSPKSSSKVSIIDNMYSSLRAYHIINSEDYLQYGILYLGQNRRYKEDYIPIRSYMLEFGYMLKVLSDYERNFLLYVGGGGHIGYETINDMKYLLSDGAEIIDKSKFIYGFTPEVKLEMFLSDKISIYGSYKGFFNFGSDLQLYNSVLSFGFRFTI